MVVKLATVNMHDNSVILNSGFSLVFHCCWCENEFEATSVLFSVLSVSCCLYVVDERRLLSTKYLSTAERTLHALMASRMVPYG